MRRLIAIASVSMLAIFNILPTTISPIFEATKVENRVKLKANNLLKFKAVPKKKEPKPRYREVKAVISYYTAAANECGNSRGITASGKKVSRGMIAAPRQIPFGTRIEIDGEIYVVEDRGGAIKVKGGVYHFDVYVPTKAEAFRKGRHTKIVKIYDNM